MSEKSAETIPLLRVENLPLNIESLRLSTMSLLASIQSRVSLETLRPLPMFLGLNATGLCFSVGSYGPPVRKVDKSALEKTRSRLQLNLAFFLSNYVLVTAMVALVVMLMYPSGILVGAIVYALWKVHAFLIRNEVEVFGINLQSILTIQQRFYINLVVSFVLVVWKCLVPALTIVSMSAFLIATHAALRDPKHIEASNTLALSDSYDEEDMEGGRPSEATASLDDRRDMN